MRKLGAIEDLVKVDFCSNAHRSTGRMIKIIVSTLLQASEDYSLLFLGMLSAAQGHDRLEAVLQNKSLLGGLGDKRLETYWKSMKERVTYRVSAEDLMTRPSFMHSAMFQVERPVLAVPDALEGLGSSYVVFRQTFVACAGVP